MKHKNLYQYLLIAACLGMPPVASAEMLTGTDEQAKLPFWEFRNEYMSLRLVQRQPDQTHAYFAGRGFSKEQAKYIASHCFFQTVYKNISTKDSPRKIEHSINDWQYHWLNVKAPMIKRTDWGPVLDNMSVAIPQRVAFEWSLLPDEQVFNAGDYNWGMAAFDLPQGARFNLDIAWKVDGKPQKATLEGISCATNPKIDVKIELVPKEDKR